MPKCLLTTSSNDHFGRRENRGGLCESPDQGQNRIAVRSCLWASALNRITGASCEDTSDSRRFSNECRALRVQLPYRRIDLVRLCKDHGRYLSRDRWGHVPESAPTVLRRS